MKSIPVCAASAPGAQRLSIARMAIALSVLNARMQKKPFTMFTSAQDSSPEMRWTQMKRNDLPKVGSCCWAVFEHLYYIAGNASPRMEYCVAKAEITSVFAVGRNQEIRYTYQSPEGHRRIGYSKIQDIGVPGKSCFLTCGEAALEAKRRSDSYDRTWGFSEETPISRPWEHLLPTGSEGSK